MVDTQSEAEGYEDHPPSGQEKKLCLHTPDLILFLLSRRKCHRSKNPHTTKSRCSESVVVSWLLSVRLISEIKTMKGEETSEETSIR